jgi:hypothetical protein
MAKWKTYRLTKTVEEIFYVTATSLKEAKEKAKALDHTDCAESIFKKQKLKLEKS